MCRLDLERPVVEVDIARLQREGLAGADSDAWRASSERLSASKSLPRLGARLYRLQRAAAIAAGEWRRIWQVYNARRRLCAA